MIIQNTVYFRNEGERGQIVDVDGEANVHFISRNHSTNYLPTISQYKTMFSIPQQIVDTSRQVQNPDRKN